ncbi:MAG TPA: hypothetical protein VNZ64_12335 [Candidatus Acidoferrum sp.]|jgi:hypothetical protein|nr:hypothetical protein [Candidatus Acidoferrum sp.]
MNDTENQTTVAIPTERMAFTLRETAAICGFSYISAFRLVQRGLLKSSSALRTKIISKSEIERFLRDTVPGNESSRPSTKKRTAVAA